MNTLSCGLVVILGVLLCGCSRSTPVTVVSGTDIPYTKRVVMKEGDAFRIHLPDGKQIAVWCQRPEFPVAGEQETASGLKTCWGERPFVQPELIWKRQPDGSEVAAGWKSYIEQGVVSTDTRLGTSEYVLYVDKWQFSIIEDLSARGDLPVTIKIVPRPAR